MDREALKADGGDAHRCICPGGTVPVYRAYHEPECPLALAYDRMLHARDRLLVPSSDRMLRARAMLADPDRAAIEMSGMTEAEIADLRHEFEGGTGA